MAEAWSPVQIHLAGSPPVEGGLPVGCLASSGGGLSPVQDHLAGSPPVGGGLPVGCLASSDGGGLVPGAGLAATKYLLER